jgi:transketolase
MATKSNLGQLKKLATLIRYYSLASSTRAGSGHPTSSLSAVELMVGLMFGGIFRYDLDHPDNPNNDRLIFSKGHASPLFYSLWLASGKVSEEELLTYRQFGSPLEGHPTVSFPYTEAATGSLGQGLSIGAGMALNAKCLDKLPYRTYVLLGDSEMAEGSQWEALELAAHYGLNNLTGILDVNRLGQRGETMYGYNLKIYQQRLAAFGWKTIVINGHDLAAVLTAYRQALRAPVPTMIIAKTIKGKGVSFIEGKNGWHGKVLDEEEFKKAAAELGPVDKSMRGEIARPEDKRPPVLNPADAASIKYPKDKPVATRLAFGNALKRLYPAYPLIVSLDGEVSNSTFAEIFGQARPSRFFEMYIAEQNMAGMALGLARRGKIPFASTFAAFWTRAFDQIRMSQYSDANIKFVGSHAGVSIGEDGPSQMGLEDIAMFRSLLNSVVLHPCDAVSTEKLVEELIRRNGLGYLRTLRQNTPIIYDPGETFEIGGCKVLRQSANDQATLIGAGATVHEALAAYDELQKRNLAVRVIDLYSIKPLDEKTLLKAARETPALITVEDHYTAGGIGEAVLSAIAETRTPVHILAVRHKPKSGKGPQLRDYEGISAAAIVKEVEKLKEECGKQNDE